MGLPERLQSLALVLLAITAALALLPGATAANVLWVRLGAENLPDCGGMVSNRYDDTHSQ
jgi:hypothetical protein